MLQSLYPGEGGLDLSLQRLIRHALGTQLQLALAHVALDVIQIAAEQDIAAVDQRDVIADFLHIAHLVGGKDDQPPLTHKAGDSVLEHLGVHRVQPAEGLIEDQDIRLIQKALGDLYLLLVALGEGLQLFVLVLAQAEIIHPLAG